MGLRFESIVVDCADVDRMISFWAELLGRPIAGPDAEGDRWIEGGDGFPPMLFEPVPEAKSVKNRVHIDLRPEDQDAEVARAENLGARRVDIGQKDVSWVVLADPEGNEFCILRSRRPAGEPA